MEFLRYGTVAASPFVPTDQRLEGPQGLTFRTAPQASPMRLTGPLALHLVAASDATDTDWYAKVADVAPDGTETFVTEGSLRASHRRLDAAKSTPARPYHPHTNPEPITPGRFYAYDVEIWPTAYDLAPGHRLQLRLTSSDLPTHLPGTVVFDKDKPQDAKIELLPNATNTIRMRDSYLTLSALAAEPAAAADRPGTGAGASPTSAGERLPATGADLPLTAIAGALVLAAAAVRRRTA
jgi:putative CocE/NonD family hydrolase